MAKRTLVTLLTDFGTSDAYVAAMKGVLLSGAPQANIVDISHDIPPHDVLAGAFVLAGAARWFPPGTLHLVVVDPGVGTDRRILAARLGGQIVLCPDNGLLTLLAAEAPMEAIFSVRNTQYVPAPASRTFDGRDVMAPVAAQILNGLDISLLGPQPGTFKLLDLGEPTTDGRVFRGKVIYVDHFGNLVSNIRASLLGPAGAELDRVRVTCAGRAIGPLQGAYGFVPPGELLAIVNSAGYIEVAANQASAAAALGVGLGADVTVELVATP